MVQQTMDKFLSTRIRVTLFRFTLLAAVSLVVCGLCVSNYFLYHIDAVTQRVRVEQETEAWKEEQEENQTTWTLNMFEMTFDTHKDICLNHPSPPSEKNETWPAYIDYIERRPNPDVVDIVRMKFLAYYFPQWHPTPINDYVDDWRFFSNPNFTLNARSIVMTRPRNHIYYDPRCLEMRRTQAALAKKYLLDGFIYYFYFSENEWYLSHVLKRMLLDGEPNTDFAIMWVNEKFAGRNTWYDQPEVLATTLLPFLKHPRYITVNGRPVLYLYVGTEVPAEYMSALQDALVAVGVPKLYIITAIQHWRNQRVPVPFADAHAEFPPNIGEYAWRTKYKEWPHTGNNYHLGLSLNFDNTPRLSQGNPKTLPQALSKNRTLPSNQPNPDEFRNRCIGRVTSWYNRTEGEKLVSIFAWNEWSEQASLEPDDLWGYGYLEALQDCRLAVSYLEKQEAHSPEPSAA